jgi:glycosyltransferase 2 family protein
VARIRWRSLVVAALTVGLLWLFFRHVDVHKAWRDTKSADPWLLLIAVALTLVTYLLRAIRWQAILRPIGHARLRTAFRTTVIGFTASYLLPARVGEVLKPYLLARQEGLKPPATFATVVVERVLDLVIVLVLFAGSLPFIGIDVGPKVKASGGLAALGAVTALGILFICAGHPERFGRWVTALTRLLPARIAETTGRMAHVFAEGLAVMRRPSHLAAALAWSVPLWVSIALGIWVTSRAFDLTFSFAGTFLVVMYLVVGVSVPTQGGAGGFHLMYQLAVMQFFGASYDTAVAAAFVLYLVSFVPITILGLIYMSQDGLSLGRLQAMKDTAEAAEEL